jgi:hypothetical protein
MVNIQFGSNFMGKDEFHELTGQPYLATTHYGMPFPKWLTAMHFPPRPDQKQTWGQKLRTKIFLKAYPSKRGTAYSTRKWPNMPYRLVYEKLWRPHKAKLCQFGIHMDKADIIELDASIWRAECLSCNTLVKPKKPRPANEDEARRHQESNASALEQHLAIVAYHEGRGPCPFCTPPEGELHADYCWEVEDLDLGIE